MQRQIRKLQSSGGPHLTVGVLRSIGPCRLAGFLAYFEQAHPGLKMRLSEGMPGDFDNQLQAGEIDAAVMARPDGYPGGLDLQPLYRERFLVAFGAGHRFAAFDEIPMKELDGETYLRRLTCEPAGSHPLRGLALLVRMTPERPIQRPHVHASGISHSAARRNILRPHAK